MRILGICVAAALLGRALGTAEVQILRDGGRSAPAAEAAGAPGARERYIAWRDLQCTHRRRPLLRRSSGQVKAGRLMGVLGPTGSGKSTFLAALGGTVPATGGLRVGGRVWGAGGRPVHIGDGDIALLSQSDAFFSELTVEEVLTFVLDIQGGDTARTAASSRDRVRALLRALGLQGVAERRVGDRASSTSGTGLSGGEQRRLAVACELLGGAPRLLLADEPTTGLDSATAEKVVALLRKLSRDCEMPSVAVLHQPSSRAWRLLDDVCLLAPGGRVLYSGPSGAAVEAHFRRLGFALPPRTNPAEWLIGLASVASDDAEEARRDEARVAALAAAFRRQQRRRPPPDPPSISNAFRRAPRRSRAGRRPGFLRRVALLSLRSWRQSARRATVNVARALSCGGLALLFRLQFGRLGPPDAVSVADRVALLSFSAISMAQLAVMKTLDVFGREKRVVSRERQKGYYGGAAYLCAKLLSELPLDAAFAAAHALLLARCCAPRIPAARLAQVLSLAAVASATLGLAVGAAVPDGALALVAGAPLMVVHMVTGIINPSGAGAGAAPGAPPPAPLWRLARALSPIRWAIEALCVGEFEGMEIDAKASRLPQMGGLALVSSGDMVLERLGVPRDAARPLRRLAALSVAHAAAAALFLVATAPRHLAPRAAAPGGEEAEGEPEAAPGDVEAVVTALSKAEPRRRVWGGRVGGT